MFLDALTDSGLVIGRGNAVKGHRPTRCPERTIKNIVLYHDDEKVFDALFTHILW